MNRNVAILALGMFALGTDTFIVAGVLPQLARDLEVSLGSAAAVVTVFSLTYALGAPALASLTAALPRRTMLIGAMSCFAVANLMSTVSLTLPMLLISRMVAALAAATYSPIATAAAAAISPPHLRGRAVATVIGGLAVAMCIGVPAGTFIGTQWGWRAAFLFVTLLGAASTLLLSATRWSLPTPASVDLATRLKVWGRPEVLSALAVTAISITGVFMVYTFIGPFVATHTTMGAAGVPLALLTYGIGAIVGSALGGIATDQVGSVKTIAVALIALLVSLSLLPLAALGHPNSASNLVVLVAMFLWGGVGWAYNPAQAHRLLALGGVHGPIAVSGNVSAIHLGVSFGAIAGSALISRGFLAELGWFGGAAQIVALTVLSVSASLAGRRHRTSAASHIPGVVLKETI